MKINDSVEVFINREMWNNTYVVFKNHECVIIDLSRNASVVERFIKQNELKVLGIILTHGHYDHIGTSFEFAKKYQCKIYINEKERIVILKHHLAEKFNIDLVIDESLIIYFKGPVLQINGFKFDIGVFPGHTQGSTILKYEDCVFTGDVVFFDSIGRTDLPTGDSNQMERSLDLFVKTYHDNDWILTGHGQIGKLKDIKIHNQFLNRK